MAGLGWGELGDRYNGVGADTLGGAEAHLRRGASPVSQEHWRPALADVCAQPRPCHTGKVRPACSIGKRKPVHGKKVNAGKKGKGEK